MLDNVDSGSVDVVERFRAFVQNTFGIEHDESKLDILWEVLRERQRITGIASDPEYLEYLRHSSTEQEAVVRRITISETYFFRIPEQFAALENMVLPEIMKSPLKRTIRILSCGCASGEEPYTIAMLVADRENVFAGWSIEITGIDLNSAVLETARSGRYSQWSLRATPERSREKFFEQEGRHFRLNREIRQMVAFRQHNLYQAPLPAEFDVIFFRNVLIYLSPDAARRAIKHITTMIAPRGYLFLGSAETLRGISDSFEILHTNGAFYYQHSDRSEGALSHRAQYSAVPASRDVVIDADLNSSWFDDIHHSANRIRELLQQKHETAHLPNQPVPARAPAENSTRESHNQAGEELTLSVVLHLNQGDVNSAEQECQLLLEHGGMDASAHYLMALCREQRGDIDGAIQQDEIAAYLDPTFAMPQLHMGILACRHGNRATGRRSLEKCLELLRTEDVSRILLLGGGFYRQSLLTMCERELERCRKVRV
jgi:chemotaxis protein methyltransferase CheR